MKTIAELERDVKQADATYDKAVAACDKADAAHDKAVAARRKARAALAAAEDRIEKKSLKEELRRRVSRPGEP